MEKNLGKLRRRMWIKLIFTKLIIIESRSSLASISWARHSAHLAERSRFRPRIERIFQLYSPRNLRFKSAQRQPTFSRASGELLPRRMIWLFWSSREASLLHWQTFVSSQWKGLRVQNREFRPFYRAKRALLVARAAKADKWSYDSVSRLLHRAKNAICPD